MISFRIDWLDFLAVQGTLNSLLQHYSLKASILHRHYIILNTFPGLLVRMEKGVVVLEAVSGYSHKKLSLGFAKEYSVSKKDIFFSVIILISVFFKL